MKLTCVDDTWPKELLNNVYLIKIFQTKTILISRAKPIEVLLLKNSHTLGITRMKSTCMLFFQVRQLLIDYILRISSFRYFNVLSKL